MSDQDAADRLSRAWDEFVNRPGDARMDDGGIDPTIREVHAADRPQLPDPEFRAQLRKQIERQAQYRAGQRTGQETHATGRAATPVPTVPPDQFPPASRRTRPIEYLAIAALLALVGAAIFWAIEFRPTHDDPTSTVQLAATSPDQATEAVIATPEPTATDDPTATVRPSATATKEPTAPATTQPSPTATQPPTPSATALPIACVAVIESPDAFYASIANPHQAPGTADAASADARTIGELDMAVASLIGCLGETDQAQRRLEIAESLQRSGMDQLDAFRVAQDIDRVIAGDGTLSDYRLIDASSAVALLSIDGVPMYRIFFAFDADERAWTVSSLAGLVDTTPIAQPSDPGESGDGGGGEHGSSDDSSSSDTGGGGSGKDDGDDAAGDDGDDSDEGEDGDDDV